MWDLFIKGGPIMYLLLLCSFGGLYISVQKFLFFKVNKVSQALVIEKVKAQLITIGKEQTIRDLLSHRNASLKLLANAVRISHLPKDDLQDGLKQSAFQEIPKLEKNMNILSSIITVAPILGLLGTVLGLMDIFNVISGGGLGDSSALSVGIAEALITTVSGLGIAVPFIFSHQYLSHAIEIFIIDNDRMVTDVLQFCKNNTAVKA
jgi:biopolymer transport protein ExbB